MTSHSTYGGVASLLPEHTSIPAITNNEDAEHKSSRHERLTGMLRASDTGKIQSESTSNKATAAFVRRTLCSHNVLLGNGERGRSTPQPIEEVLPPLTSSNEIDLQLYAIISVIIKDFVHTWYSKITPDHVFVNEVIQIIAHCTRGLEQRLREVDLESLFFDEIPELVESHLYSYRLAKRQANSQYSMRSDIRNIYHTLHPHPALSPVPTDSTLSTSIEQRENESAWRQLLVQGLLTILLPTEDLENSCLRALVGEIFAEMILGNGISGKACEGWMLWEGITSIATALRADNTPEKESKPQQQDQDEPRTRLERFGLLSSGEVPPIESKQQHNYGECHHKTVYRSVLSLFWTCVQCALLAWTALRALIVNIANSSSLPSRSDTAEKSPANDIHQSDAKTHLSNRPLCSKRPIVSMKLWSLVAQLVELDIRMPWLSGSISMLHWGLLAGPGKVGGTDGILDRYLSHAIRKRMLDPAFLPICLRTIRATLFPNNSLGPARQPPSPEEAKAIRRRCAASLLDLLPPGLASTFFASQTSAAQLIQIEDVLSCLDDVYLNKHMIYQIIEVIIIRLVPELGERGVCVMIEERLG